MRGMRLAAKGVQDENVQVFEKRHGSLGNGLEIRNIRGVVKAKSQYRQIDVKRTVGTQSFHPKLQGAVEDVGQQLGDSGVGIRAIKDIGENAADGVHATRIRVNVNGLALPKIEGANVVQTEDMVGVLVREHHRVQPLDSFAQSLGTEVGRGVNNHSASVEFEHKRCSRPVVVRVDGPADPTMTAQHRNAGGCSGPQEAQSHLP